MTPREKVEMALAALPYVKLGACSNGDMSIFAPPMIMISPDNVVVFTGQKRCPVCEAFQEGLWVEP